MATLNSSIPNSLTGNLSSPGSLSGNISVGYIKADMNDYYDKDQVDELLENKADTEHNHDDDYVTRETYGANLNVWSLNISELKNTDAEIKALLGNKADTNHTHSYNDLTDLPDLEDIGIDTSNLATKEELNGKSDVDHDHIVKNGMFELSLQEAYEDLNKRKMSEIQVNTIVSNYAAPIEHDHIVKVGMAEYDTQEAFDMLRTELGKKADITYVDNAINGALGNIESELDEILGEEV